MARKSRFPKPPPSPEGFVWLHGELHPLEDVQAYFRRDMRRFDALPRPFRDLGNALPLAPASLKRLETKARESKVRPALAAIEILSRNRGRIL